MFPSFKDDQWRIPSSHSHYSEHTQIRPGSSTMQAGALHIVEQCITVIFYWLSTYLDGWYLGSETDNARLTCWILDSKKCVLDSKKKKCVHVMHARNRIVSFDVLIRRTFSPSYFVMEWCALILVHIKFYLSIIFAKSI